MKHCYNIDRKDFIVDLDEEPNFQFGNEETLIERFGYLTRTRNWFADGFSIENSSQFFDANKLYAATQKQLSKLFEKLIRHYAWMDFL